MHSTTARLRERLGGATRLIVVGAALALALPAALLAWSIVSNGDELHACYVPASGTVYLIKQPGLKDACNSPQHVEFSWSVAGEPGPQGPDGPEGPQGEQGPAGPAGGIAGISWRVLSTPLNTTPDKGLGAQCAPGEVPINWGYEILREIGQPRPPVVVYRSASSADPETLQPNGWQINAVEIAPTDQAWGLQVEFACAPGE